MSLFLFDMDNTLITAYLDNPDKNFDKWELLPGRREKLQALYAQGHALDIVTNQGGVAFGYVTADQARAKIEAVVQAIGVPMGASYCFSDRRGKEPWNDPKDADRRKPSGRMLEEAIRYRGMDIARDMVTMVGDRQEDYDAAEDAHVGFIWASDFFEADAPKLSEPALAGSALAGSLTDSMFDRMRGAWPNQPAYSASREPVSMVMPRDMLYTRNPNINSPEIEERILDLETGLVYDRGGDLLVVSSIHGKAKNANIAVYCGASVPRVWQALKSMALIVSEEKL